MNVYLFSFTKRASMLSLSLYQYFTDQNVSCTSFTMPKYTDCNALTPLTKPLKDHISDCFQKENLIIFISACGICVRSIAPFIEKKTKDPCVLVVDEKANFVISLLSGHIGGGNEFTMKIAGILGATPVISTATDLNHKFAVDVFAKKNDLHILDMKLAKDVSASLLDGINIGISGVLPQGQIPDGLLVPDKEDDFASTPELGISICPFSTPAPFSRTLHLIPKQIVLGMGCKRNTDYESLREFTESILAKYHIYPEAIAAITSIDLKKDEEGLLALSEHFKVPFITYQAEELLQVPGTFSASSFVKSVTGVDNVCERSALAYSNAKELFLSKTAYQGMTISISLKNLNLQFE